MSCGIGIILDKVLEYSPCLAQLWDYPRLFSKILPVPHNVVMDMNNVMYNHKLITIFCYNGSKYFKQRGMLIN